MIERVSEGEYRRKDKGSEVGGEMVGSGKGMMEGPEEEE